MAERTREPRTTGAWLARRRRGSVGGVSRVELADFLRRRHVLDGIDYGEMAVVTRSLPRVADALLAALDAAGVPVVAVAGRCLLDDGDLRRAGFTAAAALTDLEPDPDRCVREAGPLLQRLAGRIARDLLLTPTSREYRS